MPDSGSSLSVLYPVLLDAGSSMTAYLSYTCHNAGQSSLDRDLVRVPVELQLISG